MAGLFGSDQWRLPPPYEMIAPQQAAAMGGQPTGLLGTIGNPNPQQLNAGVGRIDPNMPKPGFFSKGGGWLQVLGSLGDALSGNNTYANAMTQKRQDEREDRKYDLMMKRFEASQNKPNLSNAAKMAAEIGLQPGTQQYGEFIRRYAFKPTILQVPNAGGGVDYSEYDPSGGAGTQTQNIGGVTYYNINGEWYDNPEGL